MRRSKPGLLFSQTFTPETLEIITGALERAYETACEHYEPDRGNNTKTFGYELYHAAVHELAGEVQQDDTPLALISRDPTFRLRVGAFECACHRVGADASDDIWSSFPDNEGAACRMAEEQLWIPGMEPDIEAARKVVIAHLGNPEEGIQAIYLCIPSRTEKKRIVEWGLVCPVWQAGEREVLAEVTDTQVRAPEEIIAEPMVRPREKRREDAAE